MKIRKVSYIILFALSYFVIQTGTSHAYVLYYPGIQHRVADYQASNIGDKLAFEIRDDSLNYVYFEGAVTGVVLKYPNGSNVTLGDLMYGEFIYYRSSFNPDNSEYSYESPILWSGFDANIESPLVIGTYTLEVTMENGQILTTTINFDYLLDIPVISSRTFQIHTDSTGNVHWTWQIPEKVLTLAESYNLRVRAGIAAYSGGELVALYYPTLPVEVGYSITPANIFQYLVNQADELQFAFQVITTSARSYTKRIIISNPSYTVSIVPKKTTVVIPLN